MKPIGYWLNRTDQALTRRMDDLLAEFGLTRLAWQVLNVVQDTPGTTDADVLTTLAANADRARLAAAVDAVLADGWASRPAPARLTLTAIGRERLPEVAARIGTFRELSMTGLSPDEYGTAVSVLERMTRNVETNT